MRSILAGLDHEETLMTQSAQSTHAGRIALITGAATGIGRATAIAFANAGANLALADIDSAQMDQTRRLAEQAGAKVLCLSADLSSTAQVERMVADARADGFKIIPSCPFVAAMAKRHKDWADVMV